MTPKHQSILLLQINFQLETLLQEAAMLEHALSLGYPGQVFAHLQHVLYAAANISKACWGSKGKMATQRQPLRDCIGIQDASPLRDVDMRNNFDHFDERIDRWAASGGGGFADLNIGPVNGFGRSDSLGAFRLFDPSTGSVFFWGERFELQAIVGEAAHLIPTVRRALGLPDGPPPRAGIQ